jgi:membrane protein implicated in regulation of membrane protease activity
MAVSSTAELVRDAAEQVNTLIRDELRLAQAEITHKAKKAGTGAGLMGAAAVALFYGFGALLVAGGLALALVLPGWLSALIVFGALVLAAGACALMGRRMMKRATPAKPERTIDNVHADIEAVETAVRERGARWPT